MLIVFLAAGMNYLLMGHDLSSSSLAPDLPVTFLKTLHSNDSNVGVVSVTLSTDQSFVVGANVSAEVKIGLFNAGNTTYLIEVMFPDAMSIRTIPPYTWQQDWNYLLSDIQVVESEQIQTLRNVTLADAHEGFYGLNVTIHQLDQHFYFIDLVQIKPMSYLQEKLWSNLSFAMNFEILGLTIIMVAPIVVQLAGFVEEAFQGKLSENRQEKNRTSKRRQIMTMEVMTSMTRSSKRKESTRLLIC